jgi:hypothetical protein
MAGEAAGPGPMILTPSKLVLDRDARRDSVPRQYGVEVAMQQLLQVA